MTPETRPRRDTSPATTPPDSRRSAWHDEFVTDESATPTERGVSLGRETDPFTAVNDWLPPIPALFPTHVPQIAMPHDFHAPNDPLRPIPDVLSTHTMGLGTSRTSEGAGGVELRPHPDVSTFPCRPGLQWPFKYVVDMADGFDRIREWEDSHPGKRPAGESFTAALGIKYVPATWSDHYRAWAAAGKVDGVQEAWIKLGRSPQGEWLSFWHIWFPRRRKR